MALAKTGNGITEIRGKFGGVYFKKDSAGQHIQAMPRHVYNTFGGWISPPPHMPPMPRMEYLSSFTAVAEKYAFLAIYLLILAWLKYATENKSNKGKSKGKKIDARKWYLRHNVHRARLGLPLYDVPPRGPSELPTYTMVGKDWDFYFENQTQNLYPLQGLFHGKPWYKRDMESWTAASCYLFYEDGSWYISVSPGLTPEVQYWKHIGEDPVGIYDPSEVWLHSLIVNF
jgi:hypothetical protein